MIEVYRDSDSATVGLLQTVLEAEGIETFMRNQVLSGTEATIPTFFPAICVLKDEDVARARKLIENALGRGGSGDPDKVEEDRICPSCGESNPANFEICWNCKVELEKRG